jgi:hypothetical protein
MAAKNKNWIDKAIQKPGALRKETHTKEGKDIPVSKLNQLAKQPGTTGKRARLALTLRKMNH